MIHHRKIMGTSAAMLLSACAPSIVSETPQPVRSAAAYGKVPQALVGADARKLVDLLGRPRMDIRERTVRKLQFANGRCVLDAYLYNRKGKKEPLVTHVDTRLPSRSDEHTSELQSLMRISYYDSCLTKKRKSHPSI